MMAIRAKAVKVVPDQPIQRPPFLMHPDVKSLLAVQADDLQLYLLEDRLASLAPRLAALEKERGKVAGQIDRASASIAAEEARHREANLHVDANRALVERSQRAYESVTSPKEANAAIVQLEQTKRMVDDAERDAVQIQGRINELRHHVADLESGLAEVETRQAATRTGLETERQGIDSEIADAREKREVTARAVPRAILSKYDRVRVRKRSESVFPLRDKSCSACDTAIPTQRRAAMAASGALEMCEGCGMLLYAAE
jgi:predicted  nucleic acid-binding Zn-ribbon protein